MPNTFNPGLKLDCETLEKLSEEKYLKVEVGDELLQSLAKNALQFTETAAKTKVYGENTGFGPFVSFTTEQNTANNLIAHLNSGFGDSLSEEDIRAALMARIRVLCLGYSGIHPQIIRFLTECLQKNILPAMPALGSLGASGDLIPLSRIAALCRGEGLLTSGESVADIVSRKEITPPGLNSREALALSNGVSVSAAVAARAMSRAIRLYEKACEYTGLLYLLCGCRREALHPALIELKNNAGMTQAAEQILARCSQGKENPNRDLQEIYSIRCAPQVLGSIRQQLDLQQTVIEDELNGVSDNPVFTGTDILHGGNFHGQNIAFAADVINSVCLQGGLLTERQIAALGNPAVTGGTLLLAAKPGENAGLAGAQLTSTSLAAEGRANCAPFSTYTIPANGINQDIVPMSLLASRKAFTQTELWAGQLAIMAIALRQLAWQIEKNMIDFTPVNRDEITKLLPSEIIALEPIESDRGTRDDIQKLTIAILALT